MKPGKREASEEFTSQTFIVKNMVCNCCIRIIKMEMEAVGIEVEAARLGEIRLRFDAAVHDEKTIGKVLLDNGFEIVVDREKILIQQVKQAVIDLVHHTTFNAMVRNSDYLVERFDVSYQYLSNLFSKKEGITLEKYIISQKIEKVKELIQNEDLTLSEIAYMMGYSSVHYLSTQFKSVTNISVSDFKKDPAAYRKGLDLPADLSLTE